METIPNNLFNKLLESQNPLENFCLFQTDAEGNILDFTGHINLYLPHPPERGTPISTLFDFTLGLFPFEEKELKFTNLQLVEDRFTEVLILKGDKNTLWFLLFDVTDNTKNQAKLLQLLNSINLEKEQPTAGNLGHLELFDMVAFKRTTNTDYELSGNVPQWITRLKPEFQDKTFNELLTVFPYLEAFEVEALPFWEEKKSGVLKSGIWIENDSIGNEYLLKAYAVNFSTHSFLVIRLLENELTGGQEVYQKARELELAYEKLSKTEARLKELLEYKEKFVSIISHDLRSPIASVFGIAEMLTSDEQLKGSLDEFYHEMLLGIKSEMARLLDYNDKLYHWSNLELGNFKLKIEEIPVQKLADTVQRTAKHALDVKNVNYKTDIPKNLAIKVDITLFLQALNNLIANAIKFTPEGGEVGFEAHTDDNGNSYVSIYDKGTGMTEDILNKLFKTQTSSHGTRGEKGSGLGLGIIKKVIDTHGFSISAESEAGKGSRFTILIPRS
ncbi:MAG: HAMP domain-containing histidine kinase [Bacteroidales bacterium]|nr:HAMP domain-containing histidine kinase [Bacteroidales bacterium]